jgi:hypothetical protein
VALRKLNSKAHHGSGNKGSLSSLNRKAHHGSTSKSGMASRLNSGHSKTGKSPFPSMARGPVRDKARSAGVG